MAIVDVVKYSGTPDIFAWKYPSEELGTWTQLIVNESQEAVLFKGGQALDVFMAGRHTLETANIPILNKIVNLPFGGRSPFSAEVWFINKAHSLDIKWGTPTPIQLQDPKYKVFVPLRSFGQFGIQIVNSKKFLTKLVGTLSVFDKTNILKYFRGLYLTKVKDSISTYLIKEGITVLEINAYLDELSEYLKERIMPVMDDYGIRLINFFVNDINVPEDDPAVKKLKDALAKKAEMDIVGYSYVQERSFDTLEGAATNPGSGQSGLMGAGIGLGMGVGIGDVMGNKVGGVAQNIDIKEIKKCFNCEAEMETTQRFCPNCGYDSKKEYEKHNNTTICSECGNAYSKKFKFCPECGKAAPKPNSCPQCGTALENDKVKFCPECGESLIKKCSECGTQINGNPKFCPECGNKL